MAGFESLPGGAALTANRLFTVAALLFIALVMFGTRQRRGKEQLKTWMGAICIAGIGTVGPGSVVVGRLYCSVNSCNQPL